MILTVSNEFLLEYVLNNGVFIGDPQVIVKGQMFTLTNLANQGIPPAGSMVFTIVANEGETFFMPTPAGGSYNYTVNWGDSMQDDITDENGSHLFAAGGVYVVWLSGICSDFAFSDITESNHMIYAVQNLGNLVYNSLSFWLGSNLLSVISGTDCDTSSIVNFDRLFSGCVDLIECDLEGFDTSNATDFVGMFFGCAALADFDHSQLDMTLATNVSNMFSGCVAMLDPAPEWWNVETITQFEDCFLNNLLRPNYEDIPNDWKGIADDSLFMIYERGANRRVYISDNKGETWISRTPFAGARGGQYIQGTFATRDGQTIVLNDRQDVSQSNEVVTVSHDGGATWNFTELVGGADGRWHSCNADGQIIISPRWAFQARVKITFDGGTVWSNVDELNDCPHGCGSIDMEHIYLSIDNSTGLVSHDFGQSFAVNGAFPARRGEVMCSEDGSHVLCVPSHSAQTMTASDDFGGTFTGSSLGALQGLAIMSPDGVNVVFFPTVSNFNPKFSIDGGLTFSECVIDTGARVIRCWHSDCGSYFIADNGVIAFYSGDLIFLSTDNGANFTQIYDFSSVGTPASIDVAHVGTHILVVIDTQTFIAPVNDPTNFELSYTTPTGLWNIACY